MGLRERSELFSWWERVCSTGMWVSVLMCSGRKHFRMHYLKLFILKYFKTSDRLLRERIANEGLELGIKVQYYIWCWYVGKAICVSLQETYGHFLLKGQRVTYILVVKNGHLTSPFENSRNLPLLGKNIL